MNMAMFQRNLSCRLLSCSTWKSIETAKALPIKSSGHVSLASSQFRTRSIHLQTLASSSAAHAKPDSRSSCTLLTAPGLSTRLRSRISTPAPCRPSHAVENIKGEAAAASSEISTDSDDTSINASGSHIPVPSSSGEVVPTLAGLQDSDAEAPPDGQDQPEQEQISAIGSREARAQAVRTALAEGKLGLGFSAGGFLYSYHLGVLWELQRLGLIQDGMHMAGASAGSLAIATFNCGIGEREATQALKEFAAECRAGGTVGRLGELLRQFLHSYLPPDAHQRCSGTCHVAMTRLFPYMQPEVVSQFEHKSDLIEALLTSCHIPIYLDGNMSAKFRGRHYVDGAAMNFVPSPPTPTVIKVCCFPVNRVLTAVQPSVKRSRRVSSMLDIAVSPDAFEEFPHSYGTLLKWALLPGPDDVLDWLVSQGKRDAAAWAASMSLLDPVGGRAASMSIVGGKAGGKSLIIT